MSEPSAAHSSGTSTATGCTNMPPSSSGAGTVDPPFGPFQSTAPEPMQVDTSMPPSYTARVQHTHFTSYQLAEREMKWQEDMNERLHVAQQLPFVPDLDPHTQQHEFPRGTYDQSIFAVMQASGDPEIHRHAMIQPALDPTAFREILADGAQLPVEHLDSDQPATIKQVADMFRAYYCRIARPELEQLQSSVDMAFNMLQRDIHQIRAELRDMGQEVRQEQQEQSRLCAVVGG